MKPALHSGNEAQNQESSQLTSKDFIATIRAQDDLPLSLVSSIGETQIPIYLVVQKKMQGNLFLQKANTNFNRPVTTWTRGQYI